MDSGRGFPNPPCLGASKVSSGGLGAKIGPPGDFALSRGSNEFRPKFHEGTFAFRFSGSILFSGFRDLGTNCPARSKSYPEVPYIWYINYSRPFSIPVFGPRSSILWSTIYSFRSFRVLGTVWSRFRVTKSSFSRKGILFADSVPFGD